MNPITKMVLDILKEKNESLEGMIKDFLKEYPELTLDDIEIVTQDVIHGKNTNYSRDVIYYVRKKKDV